MRKGFGVKALPESESSKVDFDLEMASKLYGALKSHSMLARTAKAPSMEIWADQFRILRKYVSVDEIRAVVEWYVKNMLKEYTPKVHSAKVFRIKYDSLLEAKERSLGSLSTSDVEVSQEAKDIAKRFDHMNWRGTEKKLLAHFVQVSLDNYRVFHTALKTLFHKLKLESEEKTRKHPGIVKSKEWSETRLVQHLVELIPTEGTIIQKWVGMANYACWNYPNWKGDMLPFAFHYDHNRFQVMMAGYVADWRGDGGDWDRIREMIYKLIPDNKTHGQP